MSTTSKGEITLVHGDRGGGYAIVKMDTRAMAIIDESFKTLIQKYNEIAEPAEHDLEKINKIKELLEKIVYCRDSSLKE